jgi:exopolysaccharide production protein ExoQ
VPNGTAPFAFRGQFGQRRGRIALGEDDRLNPRATSIGGRQAAAQAWFRRNGRTTAAIQASLLPLLMAAALALGGGGTGAPLQELQLQLFAALVAAAWLVLEGTDSLARVEPRVWWLCALVLVLPLAQLVPLPPIVWQALPGRELQRDALALVGAADAWMPWSQTPARTLASLLAMLVPLLVMVMVAAAGPRRRASAIAAVAAMVLVSLLLGALQLSAGESGLWRPYSDANLGYLNGFQANRNAQADVVLIGMVAAAVWAIRRRQSLGRLYADLLLAGIAVVFVLACALTGSRAGIALVPVALLAVAWLRTEGAWTARRVGVWLGALAGTLFVLGLALALTGPGRKVLGRFGLGADFRWELWIDTREAIASTWPFGGGLGSFQPLFVAAERLEVVDPTRPVAAHNDWLELILEGGLPALVILIVALALVGRMAVDAWRKGGGERRPQVVFALSTGAIVALHSIVDYPLRSMAIACLAGLAAGMLAAVPGQSDREGADQ